MRLPRLSNSNSFLVYQISRYSSAVLINIFLAKSYLPVNDLAKYESFIFYASAISFFWITGISQAFLSMYKKENSAEINSLPFNTFLLLFTISILCSIVLIFSNFVFTDGYLQGLTIRESFFLSFYLVIYPVGYLIEYLLLLEKKYKYLIQYAGFSFILSVLIVCVPPYIGLGIEQSLKGLFLVALLKFTCLILLIGNLSKLKFCYREIKEIIRSGLPLAGVALIAGSAFYIDGFIVSQNFEQETFAIFRYGAREFPLFLIVASSFSTSMLPQIAQKEHFKQTLALIREKSGNYVQIFFPLAMILMLVSQHLFQWVFNQAFYESYKVFDIYLLLIISRFIFPSTILMGLKINRVLMLVSIMEFLVNIIASLLLIEYFGYLGVAYGTVIAYFFEKAMLVIYVRKKLKIHSLEYVSVIKLLIYSGLIIFIFVLKQFLVSN
jgi:O-antigen/teichoic acid export membrane protein